MLTEGRDLLETDVRLGEQAELIALSRELRKQTN
jgi:hypothetical protein